MSLIDSYTGLFETTIVVYYESINRELKIKPIYECRCDERLQTNTKRFTRLSYTGLVNRLAEVFFLHIFSFFFRGLLERKGQNKSSLRERD
jgi:hypothetical protein